MMRDALRAAKVLPAFRQALSVHMVEISPTLEQLQRSSLERHRYSAVLASQPARRAGAAPIIILANEYLDALPVHQMVRQPTAGTSV